MGGAIDQPQCTLRIHDDERGRHRIEQRLQVVAALALRAPIGLQMLARTIKCGMQMARGDRLRHRCLQGTGRQ